MAATSLALRRFFPFGASPSFCRETHYEATKQFFEDMGIKTHGFVQWYN